MTAMLERPAVEQLAPTVPMLPEQPACLRTLLKVLETNTAQALRRSIGDTAVTHHTVALRQSLEQEALGYPVDVEIPSRYLNHGVIGPECAHGLAIARKLAGREIAPHPTDSTKQLIVARQIGYTICI